MGAGLVAGILSIFTTIRAQLAYAEKDVNYILANLLMLTSVESWSLWMACTCTMNRCP